jgi:hypothetical protein
MTQIIQLLENLQSDTIILIEPEENNNHFQGRDRDLSITAIAIEREIYGPNPAHIAVLLRTSDEYLGLCSYCAAMHLNGTYDRV